MGTLDRRSLNRATLARQLLLERSELPVVDAVEHLIGLQAQTPHTWYVGLWSRLPDLDPVAVGALLTDRRLVRIAVMRSTIHLVSARDAWNLRPLVQQVSTRGFHTNWGKRLPGVDLDAVVAAGRVLVDEQPRSFTELGKELGRQWPGEDEAALAQTIRTFLALVQVPPRGVWGRSGQAKHTTTESWLGSPPAEPLPLSRMLLRYLAAFGPASVKDMQTWSGLTRLGEVIEPLRGELPTFRDEHGVELFDLPDAVRPEPDAPAPPRLLYDFDNLLLSHADRTRVATPEAVATLRADPHGPIPRFFLIDGFTAGTWTHTEVKGAATLTLHPFGRLSTSDTAALEQEAAGLLSFLSPRAVTAAVTFG
ncbi:hypothetical protein F4553_006045 [Allocatelliglobosispora scoriae]|uniref:Winged helix DNA-binding domain-containing protein n=1 Tax=Allocatelliglobosispora scoriae TaxID=643052 RepID=A0A841C159_9ACTN|nr:winged helix DNA-binding domain-containing protein [Allocatelliglobosispora scoriae]MBB5872611.1 hypothetical protein [Allocatelliglobosispora scoriae]